MNRVHAFIQKRQVLNVGAGVQRKYAENRVPLLLLSRKEIRAPKAGMQLLHLVHDGSCEVDQLKSEPFIQ